ncbi:MAG: guanine nucleotide exchange protein for ADP-robosylation factor [Bathelium mastoideum]|nr:MAG: guanine nucleotide exchange protein for ADP-robosylation factor [Bathelium mastoideum]
MSAEDTTTQSPFQEEAHFHVDGASYSDDGQDSTTQHVEDHGTDMDAEEHGTPQGQAELNHHPSKEPSSDAAPEPSSSSRDIDSTEQDTVSSSEAHDANANESPAVSGQDAASTPETQDTRPSQVGRPRTDSRSTVNTQATQRSSALSSMVFVISALDTIASSKDARKRKELGDAAQKAMSAIKSEGDPTRINPELLFRPLQLATEAYTVQVVTTALDCIGKLISYSYFSVPSDQTEPSHAPPLIERAIDTICDCFQGEATHVEIQLQIVKSLLAAILNDKIVVHGAGLLKAIRQTYNIFLLSKSSPNQQIAQGTLAQMVGTVFERVRSRIQMKEARINLSRTSLKDDNETQPNSAVDSPDANGDINGDNEVSETASNLPGDIPVEKDEQYRITLQSFENRKSFDDARIGDNAPTMVTHLRKTKMPLRSTSNGDVPSIHIHADGSDTSEEDEEDEIYIKDAFLVFRAMSKLSIKGLPVEQAVDIKSQGMRSKLLSLHIIHMILHNNSIVFTSPLAIIRSGTNEEPMTFVQAIKQHLCLSLSRNGASSVNRVFEVGCAIFWEMVRNMRVMLKKEIEVFLKEIYLAILDKRTAPVFQKQYIISLFARLASDEPRALVEIYLNYDCDRTALDNMYQRIIEHVSRISLTPVALTPQQQQAFLEHQPRVPTTWIDWQSRDTLPPQLSTTNVTAAPDPDLGYPLEYALKQDSLACLVKILRSLSAWSRQGLEVAQIALREPESRNSLEDGRPSMDRRNGTASPRLGGTEWADAGTPIAEDDPSELEKVKQHKTALTNAIKQFNFKPKRGIKVLLKDGFIASDSPEDIAKFLLDEPRFNKAALGEYLGEGDEENVKIMHAFVDSMNFTKTRFVDALRRFLQSFRLPGEAQKIDRFMLKFAERYISGNPNAFANADTAYVLAYSVIMLNTDQHSSKLKGPRMSPEDFIKNNRGINDNADLPDDYLKGIFDEITHNEIVLDTERETAANLGFGSQPSASLAANIGQALATVGRDLQREAYMQASQEMSSRTEQLFKTMIRAQKRGASKIPVSKFIPATSFKHVGPMFEVTWTPFLRALTTAARETLTLETIKLCMEGQKLAIRIACIFDLEDPRQGFVNSLAQFTNLYNFSEMKAKNIEALKSLLEVAHTEGNLGKESWRHILTCISQLDRFQLISTGVDARAVPDVLKANHASPGTQKGPQPPRRTRTRSTLTQSFQSDIAVESRSADMIRGVDKVFTNTANLNGEQIVEFVKALTEVSWQEIQSSGQSEEPRTYSLQKIVEISGYNMTRVRMEWTRIWQVLGEHFNQVGCHTNTSVVVFALNSLRQLSMRFMEIEELPGFKFQKDFLKPFEHIINNSSQVSVKDLVLRCLIQMIQARGENIRSGWRTMFGVFTVAAREPYESVVNLAFENVTQVYNTRFGVVISQGAFADLIVCLTEFSKNMKFQKKSLQAIETLKSAVPKMLRTPECPLSVKSGLAQDAPQPGAIPKQPTRQTQEEQFWFPVLFAFHDVLMTGEDLEVRSRALNYLFDTLIKYGGDFPQDFWDTLWRQLLYPIFMVLKSKSEMSKVLNTEELSVWLSTTMIQALRNMITLFTHFFGSLEYMLDRFLDLLALCICQENDTLARIGSNCLQQLILQNVTKFSAHHWNKIVNAFVDLFTRTEASALFSAATASSYRSSSNGSVNGVKEPKTPTGESSAVSDLQLSETPIDETVNNALGINGLPSSQPQSAVTTQHTPPSSASEPSSSHRRSSSVPKKSSARDGLEDFSHPSADDPMQQPPVVVTAARRRFFNQIITKCVLQLLMIETVNELFSNESVYTSIPSAELLRLMALLKKSYHFAKRFNGDRDLRTRLFREGFMKQPPNLLKQESGSASVYVSILLRMYHDPRPERTTSRPATEAALVPLCVDIVRSYAALDDETQQRNIATWRPVVVDVLEGYAGFPEPEFGRHVETFAPLVVALMNREMGMEVQRAVQTLLQRVFEVRFGIERGEMGGTPLPTPTSPGAAGANKSFFRRRGSSNTTAR